MLLVGLNQSKGLGKSVLSAGVHKTCKAKTLIYGSVISFCLFPSICLSAPCRECNAPPNVYLTSSLRCHQVAGMMSVLPFCRTCCGFDDTGTTALPSTGAWRLLVCLTFYPSIHPVPLFHHPSSPGVYVSSYPLCHSLSCHYSHWLSDDRWAKKEKY